LGSFLNKPVSTASETETPLIRAFANRSKQRLCEDLSDVTKISSLYEK